MPCEGGVVERQAVEFDDVREVDQGLALAYVHEVVQSDFKPPVAQLRYPLHQSGVGSESRPRFIRRLRVMLMKEGWVPLIFGIPSSHTTFSNISDETRSPSVI